MRKTIFAVFVVVMLTTPCIAQEIEPDGLFSVGTTVWDCTCFNLFGEEFGYNNPPPVFKDTLAFYREEFYKVITMNEEECRLLGNFRSDVVMKWYDSDFEKVGFIPVVFFEFENRNCETLVSVCLSYYREGTVFPLFDVGYYKEWLVHDWGEAWGYDNVYCFMRKLDTRHFGECTIYY